MEAERAPWNMNIKSWIKHKAEKDQCWNFTPRFFYSKYLQKSKNQFFFQIFLYFKIIRFNFIIIHYDIIIHFWDDKELSDWCCKLYTGWYRLKSRKNPVREKSITLENEILLFYSQLIQFNWTQRKEFINEDKLFNWYYFLFKEYFLNYRKT